MNFTHFDIVKRLCANNFPTYIVGGAVRDIFDGVEAHDIDIVTKATPEEVLAIFSDRKVEVVGKSFGVVLIDGFEVATFRHDRYNELLGAKNCIVTYAETIHEDLSRRDLTINALALCELSGELVDDFNGLEDLKNRVIRFVGNPDERIAEDPNRIVRAARFLAKIEGSFERETLEALQRNAHLVGTHVAKERIRAELLKAMTVQHPSLFFAALHLIGALQFIFPELVESVNHEHGKWHVEDVWTHMMIAGDKVSPKFPVLRLAAFLHDIGKPAAFKLHGNQEDKKFVEHEQIGADILEERLPQLKFSNEEVAQIAGLARSHMLAHFNGDASPKAIRKFRKTLHDRGISPRDWLRLRIADHFASVRKDPFTFSEIRERLSNATGVNSEVTDAAFTVRDLAVSGGELIEALLLTPGPLVGRLQKALLEFVVEEGDAVNTREALLEKAAALVDSL